MSTARERRPIKTEEQLASSPAIKGAVIPKATVRTGRQTWFPPISPVYRSILVLLIIPGGLLAIFGVFFLLHRLFYAAALPPSTATKSWGEEHVHLPPPHPVVNSMPPSSVGGDVTKADSDSYSDFCFKCIVLASACKLHSRDAAMSNDGDGNGGHGGRPSSLFGLVCLDDPNSMMTMLGDAGYNTPPPPASCNNHLTQWIDDNIHGDEQDRRNRGHDGGKNPSLSFSEAVVRSGVFGDECTPDGEGESACFQASPRGELAFDILAFMTGRSEYRIRTKKKTTKVLILFTGSLAYAGPGRTVLWSDGAEVRAGYAKMFGPWLLSAASAEQGGGRARGREFLRDKCVEEMAKCAAESCYV